MYFRTYQDAVQFEINGIKFWRDCSSKYMLPTADGLPDRARLFDRIEYLMGFVPVDEAEQFEVVFNQFTYGFDEGYPTLGKVVGKINYEYDADNRDITWCDNYYIEYETPYGQIKHEVVKKLHCVTHNQAKFAHQKQQALDGFKLMQEIHELKTQMKMKTEKLSKYDINND